MEKILQKIIGIIKTEVQQNKISGVNLKELEKITLKTKIKDLYFLDSLEKLKLFLRIEEAFQITIADEKLMGFADIQELVQEIDHLTKAKI